MNQHLNQSAALVSDRHRRFEAEAEAFRSRANRAARQDNADRDNNDRSGGRRLHLRSHASTVPASAKVPTDDGLRAPIAATIRAFLSGSLHVSS